MTHFIKSGTRYDVSATAAIDMKDKLPVGTYTVKVDPRSGVFFLEVIENFEMPGKIYGDTLQNVDRILQTFNSRPASTGVMLTGEKGSGKTLLAKMLSIKAAESGIPTIVINAPWCGEEFNSFIQTIEQATIIIFDEFEKVYDHKEQEAMLTLLDGVYPSKKLFIITSNDKYRVNEHMRNRPGRIFYRLDYKGLDRDFIIEYCEDNLVNKTYIDTVARIAVMFTEFNFDILKAMVEEMNRYDESPQQVMKVLNAKPEASEDARFDASFESPNADPLENDRLDAFQWAGNPLSRTISVGYYSTKKDEDGESEYAQALFSVTDLKTVDSESGKFNFVNAKGEKLSLVKAKPPVYSYDMM